MTIAPQLAAPVDSFDDVHCFVSNIIAHLRALPEHSALCALEQFSVESSREFGRRMLQARFDEQFRRERIEPIVPKELPPTARFRSLSRAIRTQLGLVVLTRLRWRDDEDRSVLPRDESLNLALNSTPSPCVRVSQTMLRTCLSSERN